MGECVREMYGEPVADEAADEELLADLMGDGDECR